MEKLDIGCQLSGCEQPAAGFIRYPDDITLAACQVHISRLCPHRAELLINLSRSERERLYKEARQWDEWSKNHRDPSGTVCRDAAPLAAAPDNLSRRSD
jgi:hypothetical protein